MVYIIPFIYLFILSYQENFGRRLSKPLKNIALFISFLYMLIVASIRYGMGTDFFNYLDMFNNIRYVDDYSYIEPGFRYLIVLFKTVGFSPQFLFFIFAFITLAFLYKSIIKNSYSSFLSLFIYLSLFYTSYVFNGIRQAIVMSIYLYSISYILDKNLKVVLVLTLFAVSFHSTGIFILISYFLLKKHMNKKELYIMFLFSIFSFFISFNYYGILIKILPLKFSNKLILYMSKYPAADIIGLAQRILILIPFFLYYDMLSEIDNKFVHFFQLRMFGFLLYTIFSFQGVYATRIDMFFRILEILLIPYLFRLELNKISKVFIYIIVVLWLAFVYSTIFFNPDYYPFQSVLNF